MGEGEEKVLLTVGVIFAVSTMNNLHLCDRQPEDPAILIDQVLRYLFR